MRTALIAVIGAATLAGLASPAAAQTPTERGDARCLLVLQAVSRDPKQKEAAARGIFYFMGKVVARGGVARIEPVMLAEGRLISSPQQAQAELVRCGGELQARTKEYEAVGQRLSKQFNPAVAPATATPPKK